MGEWTLLYPRGCNQVLEALASNMLCCSFCCTDYLLCPHVELLLTHMQTLIFLSLFFPGISIYSVTCARDTQLKLRLFKPCLCLPYVDLPWDTFFLISLIYSTPQSPYGYYFIVYSGGSLFSAFQRFVTEAILSGTHCVPGSSNYPP